MRAWLMLLDEERREVSARYRREQPREAYAARSCLTGACTRLASLAGVPTVCRMRSKGTASGRLSSASCRSSRPFRSMPRSNTVLAAGKELLDYRAVLLQRNLGRLAQLRLLLFVLTRT